MRHKGRSTGILLLLAIAIASGLNVASCTRRDPIRDVWASAVRGEYGRIKDVYLASAPRDVKSVNPDGHNLAATCVEALAGVGDDGAVMTLVELMEEGRRLSFRIARAVAWRNWARKRPRRC